MNKIEHQMILRILLLLTFLPFAWLLLAILIELSGRGVETMIRNGFYPSAFWGISISFALVIYSLGFHFHKYALCGIGMIVFNALITWLEYMILVGYSC